MEKLLQMFDKLISKVEALSPRLESVKSYLLNNLQKFREISYNFPSQHDFENDIRVLSRFCMDSMDWDDPVFKAVSAITEQARLACKG